MGLFGLFKKRKQDVLTQNGLNETYRKGNVGKMGIKVENEQFLQTVIQQQTFKKQKNTKRRNGNTFRPRYSRG